MTTTRSPAPRIPRIRSTGPVRSPCRDRRAWYESTALRVALVVD
jgi:hypothetical protein